MSFKQTNILTKKSSFIEVAYSWLDSIKDNVKIQTYQRYTNIIVNHFEKNILLEITISKLTKKTIMTYLTEKDNELSGSTMKTIIYIIKAILKYGMDLLIVKSIDLTIIKKPKIVSKKIEILSKTDQLHLEEYLKKKMNIRKLGILLCLYTGLRIGEICALKWQYINLNNKELKIVQTVLRIKDPSQENKTKLIMSTPKSRTSIRTIPIPEFLGELLKEYQLTDEYFLLSKKKTPYEPRVYEYFFNRVLKNCELNHIKFHVLRHTFATRTIEAGIDIKTLSELLGHSSVNITLEIYVHSSLELKRSSLQKLVYFMEN